MPVARDDELGTIKKLSSGQEGPGKIGAIEHRFEEVRAIQVGAGQVRLTFAGWLRTRETEAAETPAHRATSLRVAMGETIAVSRQNR